MCVILYTLFLHQKFKIVRQYIQTRKEFFATKQFQIWHNFANSTTTLLINSTRAIEVVPRKKKYRRNSLSKRGETVRTGCSFPYSRALSRGQRVASGNAQAQEMEVRDTSVAQHAW
jgi:hypothetical protein